ncbi:MAG: RNA-binding S4 domain-containing protein [Tepidimonas sp.]|uniref:RNA-binding S4 domain-containing protein n=1 Tax=Tepidimonas sp. TaxID=2002775 RepID=UPI00259ECDD6|nr:RNA-binding S4 domain-containing protein [Tepidimonas sp.]MDM7457211.1 RNA-binding S4 domain-containing protein [Tepidimonas sp.]
MSRASRALACEPDCPGRVRLDKWLWAARFYKTRALAAETIERGRVLVNGVVAKASREPRVGDVIELRTGDVIRTVVVRGLSTVRGPAPQAALLYEETPESIAARERYAELRRLAPEPAATLTQGRPTKRDRRRIEAWRTAPEQRQWNARWSASLDD